MPSYQFEGTEAAKFATLAGRGRFFVSIKTLHLVKGRGMFSKPAFQRLGGEIVGEEAGTTEYRA
jgi:hypothetical protein